MANAVSWFEIPVSKFDRARMFYESVLSTRLHLEEGQGYKMGFFSMDTENYGAGGALVEGEGYVPGSGGSLIYFYVESIDRVEKEIVRQEGTITQSKTSIGPNGFILKFKDTEGNIVALHQRN